MFHGIREDFRFALRMLRKTPAFTLTALGILAIVIGFNTSIFSLINAVLFRPLPYQNHESLIRIEGGSSFLDVADLNDRSKATNGFAGYRANLLDYSSGDVPERVKGSLVTGTFFELLQVQPQLGRTIQLRDDVAGGPAVVLLSSDFWHDKLRSRRDVLGSKVTFNNRAYTVIGVMPETFRVPELESDAWMPLNAESPEEAAARGAHTLLGIGRLKDGVSLGQAQSELDGIGKTLEALHPEDNTGRRFTILPWHEYLVRDIKPALLLLLGSVLFILLLGTINIANLLLAKSAVRQKEIAIRAGLGAGRGRLIRQLLIESVVLSFAGGFLGFFVAVWTADAALYFAPESMIQLRDFHIDLSLFVFTAIISLGSGLLFGIVPAMQISRWNLQTLLKEGGQKSTASKGGRKYQSALIVAQMAIALLLIAGAALLLRSFENLIQVDPGFKSANVMTFNFTLSMQSHRDIAKRNLFYEGVQREIQKIPGVISVAAATDLPFGTGAVPQNFVIDGKPPVAPGSEPEIFNRAVMPGYFETLQIRLLKGRAFERTDLSDTLQVAVVNEATANTYFPNEDPIGKRIAWARESDDRRWLTIVGVVADVAPGGLHLQEVPAIYSPHSQENNWWRTWMNFVVRTDGSEKNFAELIRRQVASVDKSIPVAEAQWMDTLIEASVADRRFVLLLVGAFALIGLLLAITGLYGLISFLVTQRTHEIGIRVALGATRGNVMGMILRYAARLAILGVFIGAAGSFYLFRSLQSLLYGIKPHDPVTLIGCVALLTVTALLAASAPARRAGNVSPSIALRYE